MKILRSAGAHIEGEALELYDAFTLYGEFPHVRVSRFNSGNIEGKIGTL